MSFTVLEKGAWAVREALEQGQVSISKTGQARFCREDLDLVGITDSLVILLDQELLRLAFRKPRSGEEQNAYRVTGAHSGKRVAKTRATVQIGRALREIRLEPEAVAGRYELTTKDDLLILNLANGAAGTGSGDED